MTMRWNDCVYDDKPFIDAVQKSPARVQGRADRRSNTHGKREHQGNKEDSTFL